MWFAQISATGAMPRAPSSHAHAPSVIGTV
jgi:hypothetical protein